ncbi:hypothetical protein GYA19_03940 [Candidatus Beckwithbacteria bacterium]|nr:hypothetical protein [Candidatus Beckwithbacteria bacterium]
MLKLRNNHRENNKITSRFSINHFLIIILAFLVGAQVILSNKVATKGQLLSQLEDQAVVLEEENQKLLSANVDDLSLNQLSKYAQQLGFVEPEEVINLSTSSQGLAMR